MKALDFYLGMAEDDEAITAFGFMDEPQAAFKAGRAGMHIDGSFRIGSLNKTRGLKWGVTELPATSDGTRSNYSSYWVNAITTKAEGEKYDAAVKFMAFVTSDEAMQIWLDVVGELPAKPSVGLTEDNANNPVYGPFIRGLEYANTTKFANESGQRQLMVDMVERVHPAGHERGRQPESRRRGGAEAAGRLLQVSAARRDAPGDLPARAHQSSAVVPDRGNR